MKRTHACAVAVGLVAMALCQYCVAEMNLASSRHFSDSPAIVYVGSTERVLAAILYLLPGFVAGLVARTHGIFTGFLTGLLGGPVIPVVSAAAVFHIDFWNGFTSTGAAVSLLSAGIATGISCAAAGGSAELLRSNFRWSGP
jgi:hypothetical protein